ncbi:glucuronate isomerase [Peptoniphilus equinus]|uniref:Uronate isomerase n=1 Tax=Peptoniphilus equinus TaxID=3016343 RepID=A0ABY7QUG5_9FIRM|nr:glucuronate isomerase [Peptoniphilus equinus]WBW50418.1 glucuronate isomerase [Peptoniphilus equinus]
MEFLTENFMLQNEYAQILFHKYAKNEPIFDVHCHLEAKDIYENKNFTSITQVWLGGDHYKWRVMRASGVDEEKITGSASDYEKFEAWAKVVPMLIGNPLYHWTHLELKNYFGINKVLNEKNAKQIYDQCNLLLQQDDFSPRHLISKSNVLGLCTTNDPLDDLRYHQLLKSENDFKTVVIPAFRPDKALNIELDGFQEYIKALSKTAEIDIKSIDDLEKALLKRLDFFVVNGCKASDHGIKYVPYGDKNKAELSIILNKALHNEKVTVEEEDAYKSHLLVFLAREYAKRDIVMEIHTGAIRDNSKFLFDRLGQDIGNDAVNDAAIAENISRLLNRIEIEGDLPKILLFTLNPKDYYPLSTIGGCFNKGNREGTMNIQIGTSWWFLDHKNGMMEQMEMLAQTSVFAKFIGMLTDSRSFLSYPRHEYFRRIMCNFIGEIVANKEYPWEEEYLGEMVKNISFNNAKQFLKIDFNH